MNSIYYNTDNPSRDYYVDDREGYNLYTNSRVALDPDTGKLRWHYQFTPHDLHDWDSVHTPILADLTIGGQPRKVVMVANRNGFFYRLDRTTGKVIVAKPFVETTWAKQIGSDGRPIPLPDQKPNETGTTACPDPSGATNFNPPSFDPAMGLLFVNARETCSTYFAWKPDYKAGELFWGGAANRPVEQRGTSYGALRAIDPTTGERRWEFRHPSASMAGVISTASALTGLAPVSYMLDGRQFLLLPSGSTLTAFPLPEPPQP
jgi:alcohol dehydrogenase (cytochrome c)